MATKKKPITETKPEPIAKADPAEATAKPPLTQATETAKALDALVESRPVPVDVAQPTDATSSAAEVAWILDGPVESAVAKVFELSPDKEFTVNAVIAELKQSDPGINENSIRFTITELKRKSVIHHVRNQGHYQILKFTKSGEAKPFPNPALGAKPATKTALRGSPADMALDSAVLKEATVVIGKLQSLVQRNQDILHQIAKLRSVL